MNSCFARCAPLALVTFVCALGMLSLPARGQESPNVERARQLMRKSQTGETLTPEEQSLYFSIVKSPNRVQVFDSLGDSALDYFSSKLPQP
jgi:hypothetical protein